MTTTKELRRSAPCPCGSGEIAGACCLPIVRGDIEAPTAEALMRSRYVAYATGAVDHLARTLHPDHPDCAIPEAALAATLRAACQTYRYTGLEVREHVEQGYEAFVTFRARVFEKGRDLSFTERSRFVRTSDGWRYRSGETSKG